MPKKDVLLILIKTCNREEREQFLRCLMSQVQHLLSNINYYVMEFPWDCKGCHYDRATLAEKIDRDGRPGTDALLWILTSSLIPEELLSVAQQVQTVVANAAIDPRRQLSWGAERHKARYEQILDLSIILSSWTDAPTDYEVQCVKDYADLDDYAEDQETDRT